MKQRVFHSLKPGSFDFSHLFAKKRLFKYFKAIHNYKLKTKLGRVIELMSKRKRQAFLCLKDYKKIITPEEIEKIERQTRLQKLKILMSPLLKIKSRQYLTYWGKQTKLLSRIENYQMS